MKLKTRPVAMASAGLAVLVIGLLIWQLAKSPGSTSSLQTTSTTSISTPGSTAASGVVTRDRSPDQASASVQAPLPAPSSTPAPITPASRAAAPAAAAAAAQTRPPITHPPTTVSAIKHRVAPPQAGRPAILPNEVDAVVGNELGRKTLLRYFYLDPLARRFVASVDGLGRKSAPTDLWLLKPAPGALKSVMSSQQPDTRLLKRVNSQRYAEWVQWIVRTDSARLIDLYTRMYPLLQQTYVELGHPNGYFNDRVIEVIDLLLATPVPKPPLRLRPARDEKPTSTSTPTRPRFEFDDSALESLATGQKILLRVGPQNAALLKAKLKDLRNGLVKLGRPN